MRRFPPLIAVGCITFFFGAAVSAGAAKLITGKDIKNGSIGIVDLSKNARIALQGGSGTVGASGAQGAAGARGETGATGARGDTGAKGDTGPEGQGGAAGSAGANGTPGASGVAGPMIVAGSMAADGWSSPGTAANFGSESSALVPVPPGSSYTAKNFIATVNTAPGAGRSVTIALRLNQADTSLSCTIEGDTAVSCQPPDGTTVVVPAGVKVSMRTFTSGSPSVYTIAYAYRGEF